MQVTQTIKKAPKWAWYTVGGVALGAVALRVWKGRAVDTTTTTTDTTVSGTPTPVSSQPSPVIVPPVILGGNNDSGDGGAYAGIFDMFGGVITTAMTTISGLAQGDQELATTTITGSQDISKAALAQAGGAPQPVSQLPPIQITTTSAPTPTPRATPVTTPKCPAAYPNYNAAEGPVGPKSCYKCDKTKSGSKYENIHVYQDGHKKSALVPC